jgi:hypothetical protein
LWQTYTWPLEQIDEEEAKWSGEEEHKGSAENSSA